MKYKLTIKSKFIILLTLLIIAGLILISSALLSKKGVTNMTYENISISSEDRILILAPHPDDEVLGCGGIIQKAVELGIPIKVVFLTYGDNNQWSFMIYRKHPVIMPKAAQSMGMIRHDEAIDADKMLGLKPEQLLFLGYPDFRTLNIWDAYWGDAGPGKSMLTEVQAVPYDNAYRPGALYKGDEILKDLKSILQEFNPTKIFLSHPGDFNPDHRALYLFTSIALWDLESVMQPEIYPYLIHYKNWPKSRGLKMSELLSPPVIFAQEINWKKFVMPSKVVENNMQAIKKHKSQYESSAKYLDSFIRADELFGDFPYIFLSNVKSAAVRSINRPQTFDEAPEELLGDEKENFIGLANHSVYLSDDSLAISVELTRTLKEKVGVSVYAFGYRSDRDFALMPKIHIQLNSIGHKIYNGLKKLPNKSISMTRNGKILTFKIPFDLLGNPDRLLTSGRTYFEDVPLDWVSWRVLELRKG